MENSPTSQPVRGSRRLGRPPSKIKKVTRAVRIPTDVDTFLIDYAQKHGVLVGDVVTQAVLHFRMKSPAFTTAPTRSRAASAR